MTTAARVGMRDPSPLINSLLPLVSFKNVFISIVIHAASVVNNICVFMGEGVASAHSHVPMWTE